MSDYTAEQAHAAVACGAEWLDKRCPTWASEIDLDSLDLGRQDVCMLGQTAECLAPRYARAPDVQKGLKGRYSAVLDRWRINAWGDWPPAHGFDIPNAISGVEASAAYEMLTIAWREYIRERLAVPV